MHVMRYRQRYVICTPSAPPPPSPSVSLKRGGTCVFPFSAIRAVDMPAHGDGASGAARRRRERRLRSWWKHEQQSVKAAVVSALHHSRHVGPAQHEAHGERRRPPRRRRQGSRRTLAYGHRRPCLRGCGQPAWLSHREHRSESRGTPWSSLANSLPRCRSSMLL